MSGARPDVVVFVAGGDEYAERMTRSLGGELQALDGVEVTYAYQGADRSVADTKGSGGIDLLSFTLDWVWPVAAPVIAETIRAWCKRSVKETVVVTVDEVQIVIEDGLTPGKAGELEAELGKHTE